MDANGPKIHLLTKWQQSCVCRGEGWICEAHADEPYPHLGCGAPGKPCPRCNTSDPPRLQDGWESFIKR